MRRVAHMMPKLDNFEFFDFRKSKIIAIENRLPYVIPTQHGRTKFPGKCLKSPYMDFSDSVGTAQKAPIYFKMKHIFVESTRFEVEMFLVDSFQLWIKQRQSKKHDRYMLYLFMFILTHY